VPHESQQDPEKKKIGRPRKYDEAYRQAALERMKSSENVGVGALARELGVNRTQLYRWRNEALGRKPVPRPDSWLQEKSEERQRRRIGELERLVARQALELDFFKGALLRIEENRRKREQSSGKPSTSKSGTLTGSKAD
jgi:transposase